MSKSKMKINVLHLVEDLGIGGMERMVEVIVTGLDKEKFSLQVWCLCAGGQIYDELKRKGIEIEMLGMRNHRDPFFLWGLRKKLQNSSIHILHVHGYPAAVLGRLAAISAGIPVIIYHVHSTYWEYTFKQIFIERILSFFTDKIICCSQAVADFVVRREKIRPNKTVVIYNGVDLERFKVADRKQTSQNNEFLVGCIASFYPQKGHRYLLEAAKHIIDNFSKEIKFFLVGTGTLFKKSLEEYAQEIGVAPYVTFSGPATDIPSLLATFDAVVLASSQREGLSVALIEAMACGKPVIGTTIGGIPEIIDDKINGLLVSPKNPLALADAIIYVLKDKEEAIQMGYKGREKAEELFSSSLMLREIENLYCRLSEAKKIFKGIT